MSGLCYGVEICVKSYVYVYVYSLFYILLVYVVS